jgi:acyl carrier protein
MSIESLTSSRQAWKALANEEVRTIIAKYFGVRIQRVCDEARLREDLGADWLDRLELMIVIEEQFDEVEITDEDAEQIDVVGDLIRFVEDATAAQVQKRVSPGGGAQAA